MEELSVDVSGVLTLHHDLHADISSPITQLSDAKKMNGIAKRISGGQVFEDSSGLSLLSSPFNSFTPGRYWNPEICPSLIDCDFFMFLRVYSSF